MASKSKSTFVETRKEQSAGHAGSPTKEEESTCREQMREKRDCITALDGSVMSRNVGENAVPLVELGGSIPEEYEPECLRWFVLALYSIFGFSNQMQYVAFSTIVRETQAFYSITALQVNILSIMIPVIYCILVLPGCVLYDRLGLRRGMLIGAGVNMAAALLKLISVWLPHYAWLVVGQILVALGQVLFLGLPPLVAATWFTESERTVATAIATLCGFVGMAVGMFYAPRVVFSPTNNTEAHFAAFLGSHLAASAIPFIGILLFVSKKPSKQPCATATRASKTLQLRAVLARQMKNKDLILLGLSFGLTTGIYTAVAAVLSQVLEPFGVSESTAGILAFAGIMSGSAACCVIGYIVDRIRRYKVPLLVLMSGTAILSLLLTIVMAVEGENFRLAAYALVPLVELLALPMVPCAMEFAVELTYPDEESVASSLMLFCMCFFSFVGMLAFSGILGDHPTQNLGNIVIGIAFGCNILSVVLMIIVRERRKRYDEENDSSARDSSKQCHAGGCASTTLVLSPPVALSLCGVANRDVRISGDSTTSNGTQSGRNAAEGPPSCHESGCSNTTEHVTNGGV